MHPIETISNNKIKEITKLHQKKYREELNVCKGMNNTLQQEILYRDEIIEDLKESE